MDGSEHKDHSQFSWEVMGSSDSRNGGEVNGLREYRHKNQQDVVMDLGLKDDKELSVTDDSQAGGLHVPVCQVVSV